MNYKNNENEGFNHLPVSNKDIEEESTLYQFIFSSSNKIEKATKLHKKNNLSIKKKKNNDFYFIIYIFMLSILILTYIDPLGIFNEKDFIISINSNKFIENNNTSIELLIKNNIEYTPKISVIVYVYNSEKFLQKCLETIINQTLKDIEILCIDDGSTDNSLDILKKYSKRDNRITLIKKKHMNSGIAYNIGLKMAKGNFLSFINSNDYLELNMLEKLYLKIMKYNCDIIICNSQINDIDTGKSLEKKKYNLRLDLIPQKKYFSVNEISDNIFQIFEGLVEDKLFRKDFIINNNIKFENINNFNDIQFTFTALCLANSISVKKKRNYIKIDLKNQSNTKWKDTNSFLYIFDKISLKLLQNKLYNQVKESFRKWAINLITINFCLDEISKVYLFNTIQKKFNDLDYIDNSTSFSNEYKYWSYIKYQKDLPTINIVYIVNNKNFHLCLVSITSILKNSENENINIIILYKGISLNNIHKIYELKEIRFFTLQTLSITDKETQNIELIQNKKKKLWSIYILVNKFPDINKILYLDCNIIVRKSLIPLWEMNINDKLIAAVEDISFSKDKSRKINLKDNFYFNLGVFLLNTKEWRKIKLNDKIKDFMKNGNISFLTTQDILNILTDMKKMILSPEFNFMKIDLENKNCQYDHDYLELYKKNEPTIINYSVKQNIINNLNDSFMKEFSKYNTLLAKIQDFHLNIPVVLSSDDKYAPFMYTTIISILEHKYNNTYYIFFLLVPSNFSKSNKNKIMEILDNYTCSIYFIYVNKIFENIKMNIPHISFITYYRLLIADLLPEEIDKCIYLDTDLCVCKDLSELFNINLKDNYLAGVIAAGYYFSEKKHCKRLNLPSMKNYINAGMLLMNLKQIRKDNMTQVFIYLTNKNYSSQDQDILNVACYGKIQTLPPKYNAMIQRLEENNPLLKKIYKEQDIVEAKTKPHIIHYAGNKKPWSSLDLYMLKYWWDIFKMTPFINSELINENIYKEELIKWWNKNKSKSLNIDNPKTFLEKMQWLKIYDSTPIKTMLTDKYLVREWIKGKIGEEYLAPLLAVYNSFEEIEFEKLPKAFVIKCNHGKGYNIFVKNKYQLNLKSTQLKIDKWMNENYALKSLELQYRDINHKIIIEKYIDNVDNDIKNYKFFCFNGKPYFLWMDNILFNNYQYYLYDLNKAQLLYRMISNFSTVSLPEKSSIKKMGELASVLSKDFKYVGVDFYANKDNIYFNGMIFTNEECDILPKNVDKILGSLIKIPKFAYNIDTGKYYKLAKPFYLNLYVIILIYLAFLIKIFKAIINFCN